MQADTAGEVTLAGQVSSWVEQQLATRVAKGVSGVTAVRNNLQITHPPLRPDSEIAADVETLLRWDAYLDERGIETDVNVGVATLTGRVGSAAEKRRAADIAWTAGARRVDAASLKVDTSLLDSDRKKVMRDVSDAQIAQAVHTMLRTNPTVAPNDVEREIYLSDVI